MASISETDADGEILTGELACLPSDNRYPVINGIPRFITNTEYNKSWDYKWVEIDRGKGINYRIADKNDKAYAIHDIFDRNNHGGKAYQYARDKLVWILAAASGSTPGVC